MSALIALSGCGSDDGSAGTGGTAGAGGGAGTGGSDAPSFQELYDQGLTKYVGMFDPVDAPTANQDGVATYSFAVPDDRMAAPRGPLCLRGTEYTVDTRQGNSDELVIFLQGGRRLLGGLLFRL
jgi:hypothetical protein